MTQDAFELLQQANPLPEDPPPLPIAPLMERVDELPQQPAAARHWPLAARGGRSRGHGPGGPGRRPKRRSRVRVATFALSAFALLAAIATVGLTRSTTVVPKTDLGQTIVPPEHETALGATPDELMDLKEAGGGAVTTAMVRRQQAQAAAVPAAATGLAWKQMGPYNVGGRVTDVVADRNTPNAAFAAVSGGGIWKTTDGGANWTNLWPDSNTQTMGAFAQAPNGDLWAGTGEANPPGGGLTYFGDGIYKSSDNGAHWTNMGLTDSAAIGRIAVDPKNSQRVFVAASGHIARTVKDRGLYRTLDGGKTWQLVLAPPNATTGAIDVAINPQNPQIVYASLWDHTRNNGRRFYGGVGSGLFRSKDGGDTWERLENITGPLATYDTPQTGLKSAPTLGRIGFALAPSNPNRIYVVFGDNTGPDKGSYRSDDGGDSFQLMGRAYQASGGYQWWFGRIWVDPDDQNHLFNADVSLRTSTDGGTTWTAISAPHSDQHGMDWDPSTLDGNPATPDRVFLGNDGGMYRSDNSGVNGSWVKATNQPWNQSYHLAISMQDPLRQTTGLQDNGSVKSWTPAAPHPADPDLGPTTNWNSSGGGDGHWNVVDPTDDTYYYTCSQASGGGTHSCSGRHDTATATQSITVAQVGANGTNRYTTDAPIVIDPNVPPKAADGTQPPNALYMGGAIIGRSLNRGPAMTPISPTPLPQSNYTDPDPSLPGHVPANEVDTGLYGNLYGATTALAPAKSATPVPYAQVIYAGTDTGKVWKTSDAGGHWTQMQGLPTRWVNAIIADPDNADHAYVAFSGYREGDEAANVWETLDGGATWSNTSFNLPNGPVEMLEYNAKANVLFAATDVGVFDHKDGDGAWYKVSVGLPQVPVLDVKLSADGKYLFAATFGRSIWKLNLSTDAVDGGGAGGVGASVPATLGLTLGTPGAFGAFTPGVDKDYTAATTANVVSTAGDATLSVTDPSTNVPGHLVNGTFSLPSAVQAKASSPAGTGSTAFAAVSATPLTLLTYAAPVSNDPVTVTFNQHIGAGDALRTGSYSKTLTFTLSTTTP
ncbi:MAG TPA: hypothetical protein VI300_23750 [Solirubrobacter sp.]